MHVSWDAAPPPSFNVSTTAKAKWKLVIWSSVAEVQVTQLSFDVSSPEPNEEETCENLSPQREGDGDEEGQQPLIIIVEQS